jgi:hypothetical protein
MNAPTATPGNALLTADLRDRLVANGRLARALAGSDAEPDFLPVVKLFTPDAGCTWLLTEIDPHDPDIAFGLCDLGMGCPELGYVSLAELESVRGGLGLPIERDLHFAPMKTISAYADEARHAGRICA